MIGGNKLATIQKKSTVLNSIGESVETWTDYISNITGWLDYSTGDSGHLNYSSKVEESTHIWMCDYFDIQDTTEKNSRMVIDSKIYEIKLIDNPMELNQHLEIYLRYIGIQ